MKILLFALIEILLYPITLLGLIAFMLVILLVNRPRGISGTAYEPLMNRLLMHDAKTRLDTAAKKLAAELPATHPLIWFLMTGPSMLAMRVSGFRPKLLVYPPEGEVGLVSMMTVRTQFFDETLAQALGEVEQLVILGAGWDTRAYDLPAQWTGQVFEVDAPDTQAAKVRALAAASIDASRVNFVAVDFEKSSWLEVLGQHGFDASLPTYVLWEGVTMYLNAAAVADTFASVRKLGDGSVIAFDYLSAELIEAKPPHAFLGRLMPLGMQISYGEKMEFGIPMQPRADAALKSYLDQHDMELLEFQTIGDASIYGFGYARSQAPIEPEISDL